MYEIEDYSVESKDCMKNFTYKCKKKLFEDHSNLIPKQSKLKCSYIVLKFLYF